MRVNFILTVAALVLGISAALTDFEERNGFYPDWKFRKDRIDGHRVEYISAVQLAGLLRQKDQGILVMDIRDPGDFADYHIPGSVLFDPQLLSQAKQKGKKVILYGSGQDPYAQLVREIPVKGIYLLGGGLDAWYDTVLFPDFSRYRVRNREVLQEILSTSVYFGGKAVNTESLNLTQRSGRFREGC